jgi:uncharacterized protein
MACWTQHTAPVAVGSDSSKTWATVSHLPLGGFIIPLLALLFEGPRSDYVKYHSTEALNFHITTLIVAFGGMFVAFFLAAITKGFGFLLFIPIWLVLILAPIVLGIMGMIAANKGEWTAIRSFDSLRDRRRRWCSYSTGGEVQL